MKLLAEDGYVRPNVQIAVFLILAAFLLFSGISDLMDPSTPLDRFTGVMKLVALPGCLGFAWYGYRKKKRQIQAAAGAGQPPAK